MQIYLKNEQPELHAYLHAQLIKYNVDYAILYNNDESSCVEANVINIKIADYKDDLIFKLTAFLRDSNINYNTRAFYYN